MDPLPVVVDFDVLEDAARETPDRVEPVQVDKLFLEGGPERFGGGVVVADPGTANRIPHIFNVIVRASMKRSVRM